MKQRKADSNEMLNKWFLFGLVKLFLQSIRSFIFRINENNQYPETRNIYSDNFRGMPYLKATNGIENCNACGLCLEVCPCACITIEVGSREDKSKYPTRFNIDLFQCSFCGFCEEACPEDALKLSTVYEMAQAKKFASNKEALLIQRGYR